MRVSYQVELIITTSMKIFRRKDRGSHIRNGEKIHVDCIKILVRIKIGSDKMES